MAEYAPCPKCGDDRPKKVGFTWWGGLVGPAMLSHVKCTRCATEYNGKTGQSNATGIAIYVVVSLVIVMGLVGLVFMLKAN
jgi:hypothetical protein